MERIGHYPLLPNSWCVAPMQTLCSLNDGEKQNDIEGINLDVKYLCGERDTKMLTAGKFITANSLLILVDGENSGGVFRTPIEGYQGSTFKQLLINENMNAEYIMSYQLAQEDVAREQGCVCHSSFEQEIIQSDRSPYSTLQRATKDCRGYKYGFYIFGYNKGEPINFTLLYPTWQIFCE